MSVSINDKNIGSIGSKPLSQAFAGIYTDKNAVCTLYPVGGDATEESAGGIAAFVTPTNCAFAGAAIGFGLGKLFGKS